MPTSSSPVAEPTPDGLRVVLASASPRRRELLGRLGVEPVVVPADVDEEPRPGEPAAVLVGRLAAAKARAVAAASDDLVVAADTVVVIDGEVCNKPLDDADAARMLRRLSGRRHEVITGVHVRFREREAASAVRTEVEFRALGDDEIAAYVATGEPADKAGAYAIQGGAGAFAVAVRGSDTNVIGLPLAELVALAAQVGVTIGPGRAPAAR